MAKNENCHHQENRRSCKCPHKYLADAPAESVLRQQQWSTDFTRIWDKQQESKRYEVNLSRDQRYRIVHRYKSAPDTKTSHSDKGLSYNGKRQNRGGGKCGDR